MSYTNQPQYSRRDFLERTVRGAAGTGVVLATGGLSAVLAQEAKSKTRELVELMENNEWVFPKNYYKEDFSQYEQQIQRVSGLPKLSKDEYYAVKYWQLFVQNLELPDFRNVSLVYTKAQPTAPLAVISKRAGFAGFDWVRDTGIVVPSRYAPESYFSMEVDELDFATIKGVQVPITVHTEFLDHNLDGIPEGHYVKKTAGPPIPEQFRRIPTKRMDNVTALAKFNGTLDLLLSKARELIRK